MSERPAISGWDDAKWQETLEWLDALRDSGKVNMLFCAPFLQMKFGLSQSAAWAVSAYWAETFEARHPAKEIERGEPGGV